MHTSGPVESNTAMSISDFDDDEEIERSEILRSEPLSFRWRFANRDVVQALALPAGPKQKYETAAERIAAIAYKVRRLDPSREISLGRSRTDYVGMQRYQGEDFTYNAVTWAVDCLSGAGLITEKRARAGSRGWRSTIQATDTLANLIEATEPQKIALVYDPIETIRLRDKNRRLVEYRETEFTRAARRRAESINEMTRSAALGLSTGKALGDGVYSCTTDEGRELVADLSRKEYHRVFNRDFSKGGRFYGVGWHSLPSEIRAAMTIDGEPVEETDYPALHAVLLYAHIGRAIPPDPFNLADWPRPIVKRAFYTMLNADSRQDAQGAVMLAIIRAGGLAADGQAGRRAAELLAEIERKHTAVRDFFFSGIGRQLMRADSDIAERVMLKGVAAGVVALTVHDSVIAKARHSDRAREWQDEALLWKVRQLNPDTPAPQPLPTLFLVLAEGQQLNLFGEPVKVPKAELQAWRGGVMPKAVCAGLRHLQSCQGLRQDDVAAALGISRPQLTNALQGRFGVSKTVAERVKAIIQKAAA